MEWLSLNLAMILLPLLLQKSGRKVAAKEAKNTIQRRLDKWADGDIDGLLEEGNMIQSRLPKGQIHTSPDHAARIFARLILQGKVHSALRLLNETGSGGVVQASPEVQTSRQAPCCSPSITPGPPSWNLPPPSTINFRRAKWELHSRGGDEYAGFCRTVWT